jgi:hypothetical protein
MGILEHGGVVVSLNPVFIPVFNTFDKFFELGRDHILEFPRAFDTKVERRTFYLHGSLSLLAKVLAKLAMTFDTLIRLERLPCFRHFGHLCICMA